MASEDADTRAPKRPSAAPSAVAVDTAMLCAEKTVWIIYANTLFGGGHRQQAEDLFVQAAEIELALHRLGAQPGQVAPDYSHLRSAASCFWRAGLPNCAIDILDRVIAEAPDKTDSSEALLLREECFRESLGRKETRRNGGAPRQELAEPRPPDAEFSRGTKQAVLDILDDESILRIEPAHAGVIPVRFAAASKPPPKIVSDESDVQE